jgi:hypothetical protein
LDELIDQSFRTHPSSFFLYIFLTAAHAAL